MQYKFIGHESSIVLDMWYTYFRLPCFLSLTKNRFILVTLLIVIVFIECHASERKVKILISCIVNLLFETCFSWLHKLSGTFFWKVRLCANVANEPSFQLSYCHGYISMQYIFVKMPLWKCQMFRNSPTHPNP